MNNFIKLISGVKIKGWSLKNLHDLKQKYVRQFPHYLMQMAA